MTENGDTAMPTEKMPSNPAPPTKRPSRQGVAARRGKTPDPTPRAGTGGRPRLRSVHLDEARLVDALPSTPPLPAAAPGTPAATALWAALHTRPGATGPDLAQAASIGRSTATNLLAALARAGLAHRTPGGGQGRTRRPDRWSPAPRPAAAPAAEPAPGLRPPTPAPATRLSATDTDTTVPPNGKLAGGQLRDLVAEQLRAHPDRELTPAAIAKALNRSAGAVANACVRLTVLGQATQTCPAPRRYRATTK
jgi:hypothetical protein